MRYFFLLLCLTLLQACSESGAEKPLVVGMDLSYPPFETIGPSGDPMGVSVDLAKAFADSLGRPMAIENIPFVGLIPALQSGQVDCVISSMTVTEERGRAVSFSDPYLRAGLAMLVAVDSEIADRGDLEMPGKRVVVRQGTTGEVWARENLSQPSVLVVEKENSAVLEVLQGNADAFIYDQMSVWTNAQKHAGRAKALLQPLQVEQWAMAFRKDDEALRAEANAFLEDFRASGGFERLGDRYLSEQKKAFEEAGVPFVF